MKTLEAIIENLQNKDLKLAFDDILEWRETGVLNKDSVIRLAHTEFMSQGIDFPLHMMESAFLFEIAKRTIDHLSY